MGIAPRPVRRCPNRSLDGRAIAIIAGVGFSRVCLGVHDASDVIAGWAFGVIWVGVLIAFVALLEERSAAADSTVRAGHPAASSDHD
ncbi:phosphatase PAP2 family protein [Mycobacterium sp.]|jgi:hypothetical protein|uniref:phosphatase PAP2 family protein n=1 Tax=Mycobacterium sp. TaxID=1785 RepID=UPI003F9B9EBC